LSVSINALAARIEQLLEARTHANEAYFGEHAERLARVCRLMAERFQRGGRLVALGGSPQDWSDAHHVAVEFVHPVIVGKRALPALAVSSDRVDLLRKPDDMVISFRPLTVRAGDEWSFAPPTDDPFIGQELAEISYHLLWELVHVFFDHLGGSEAGAGASGFLYPFLERQETDVASVVEDVRRSILMKSEEVAALRIQSLTEGRDELMAAAAALRARFDVGGKLLAFGNGGSATDAADAVADFHDAPQGWPSRPALDLAGDSAILTALANDIGPEVLFQRQVIAYGREGDAALAVSTSGNSVNIIEALAEARRRDLLTIALIGYDGGRVATDGLADHVIVTRSQNIPRIQEVQASVYHVLRELVELTPRAEAACSGLERRRRRGPASNTGTKTIGGR
jgi:D-sedoheptulose 7-phosphate isomerase